jgi:predicted acetyltransferase
LVVDLEMRPIVADELPAYKLTDQYGFGFRHEEEAELRTSWSDAELDRTVAVFEGDEIVGIGRNYSLELTVPGGAILPASGVSWIAVRPTHRRRGILRRMMQYLVEEGAQRGESLSMLTASEGGIYSRFGFGIASRTLSVELHTTALAFSAPVERGRIRLVEPEESLKIAPELFDRVRAQRNGAVSRPSIWWCEWAPNDMMKRRFDVVYELDGRVEGFAMYSIDGTWTNGFSDKTVAIQDLVAATPEAEAALWQYLCSIDLTDRVTHWHVPPDIELPFRLRDTRQMRTTSLRDWLWLRPVDVPAFLGARRYSTADRLVLDVRDEMRPDGSAAGRFVLDGGPDGASCEPSDAAPDIVLDVSVLGSISLGGLTASMLARAGSVEEQTPGALAVADRMFAADRAPYAFTWF